jgi:replicative DNA helicase
MEKEEKKTIVDYMIPGQEPNFETCAVTFVDAAEELVNPIPSTPIVNFPVFTEITKGLRPHEFSILCGATGKGKTTLIANWSASLMEQGVPHFVASVETGRTDFLKRVISAQVNEDWNTGDPVNVEKIKDYFKSHSHYLESKNLILSRYENRFTVQTLMNDIVHAIDRYGIKIAMIDNLNFFLDVTTASEQLVVMDKVIHDLIIFCRKIPVHLIMIMHPKKTDHGRVESEFDIKGSSTAVQEAQNVLLFNQISADLVKNHNFHPGSRELKISKMRRQGRAMHKRIVLTTENGVKYTEGGVFEP